MATKVKKQENPAVSIALGFMGMFVAVAAIVTIFARTEAWVLVPILLLFVIFGVIMAKQARK